MMKSIFTANLIVVFVSCLIIVGCDQGETIEKEQATGPSSNNSPPTGEVETRGGSGSVEEGVDQDSAKSESPGFEEITGLLSLKLDSLEVTKLKETQNLILSKMLGDQVLWAEDRSYSLTVRDGIVDKVTLKVGRSMFDLDGDSKNYSGELPEGLKPSDNPDDVTKKLGEPDSPDLLPTWKIDSLRLLIEFYEDKDGIESIIVSKDD